MARVAIPPPLPTAPAPFAIPAGAPAALDPEQVQQLLAAQARVSKLRRAVNVARFDGWTTGFFAVVTILTGFTSGSALLLGFGMAIVAYVEFAGATKLRQLDARAARQLAINQVCLGAMLILYSLWQLYVAMTGPSSFASVTGNDPQLAQMLGSFDGLTKTISMLVYGVLIAIAIFIQGGTAMYYHSRQRHLEEYVRATPKWILDLQRAGVAV